MVVLLRPVVPRVPELPDMLATVDCAAARATAPPPRSLGARCRFCCRFCPLLALPPHSLFIRCRSASDRSASDPLQVGQERLASDDLRDDLRN